MTTTSKVFAFAQQNAAREIRALELGHQADLLASLIEYDAEAFELYRRIYDCLCDEIGFCISSYEQMANARWNADRAARLYEMGGFEGPNLILDSIRTVAKSNFMI